MFGDLTRPMQEIFERQFEGNGTGYFFRKDMKAAPIHVTKAEHDSFVRAYNRGLRYAFWTTIGATIILIPMLALFARDRDSSPGEVATWVGIGLIVMPFLLMHRRAWNAPAKELVGRPVAGSPRDPVDIRRRRIAEATYGQLCLAAFSGLPLVWIESSKHDVLHGWGLLWFTPAAVLMVTAGIGIIRKWNYRDG